jgi:hypothetical protein
MVVVPEPSVKRGGALGARAIDRAVGPAAQEGPDEPFGFAVGLGPVGAGAAERVSGVGSGDARLAELGRASLHGGVARHSTGPACSWSWVRNRFDVRSAPGLHSVAARYRVGSAIVAMANPFPGGSHWAAGVLTGCRRRSLSPTDGSSTALPSRAVLAEAGGLGPPTSRRGSAVRRSRGCQWWGRTAQHWSCRASAWSSSPGRR